MGAPMDNAQLRQENHGAGASGGEKQTDDPLAKRYALETWTKESHVYKNPPIPFSGPKPGFTHPYGCLPLLLGLLEKFWSPKLQRKIVKETNRYASEIIDEKKGQTRGGTK
jgi:hypothetical protein